MSAATEEEGEYDKIMRCASCGIAGGDGDISLKTCTACHLVKYCGVKCQRDHWPKHKKECKKRAAELRDEILFKQPESSHLGDCPICCLPLSDDTQWARNILMACCGKTICCGCNHANLMREHEQKLQHKCAFCRSPTQTSEEGNKINCMKRVEANDPVAMWQMGNWYFNQKGDYNGALKYYIKGAELGDIEAHYNLSRMYSKGLGVGRDKNKELYHLEEAAIGGHVLGRHFLGGLEEKIGRLDRALKHWIIAAKMGYDASLGVLKEFAEEGMVSKEDLASAIRGHQAAVDATKSPQRETAAAIFSQQRQVM